MLLSWAVTRGPSDDPARSAWRCERKTIPLEYADFEGSITAGNYGAGNRVMLVGSRHLGAPSGRGFRGGLSEGKLKFVLDGERMKGGWTLVRMKPRSDSRTRSAKTGC